MWHLLRVFSTLALFGLGSAFLSWLYLPWLFFLHRRDPDAAVLRCQEAVRRSWAFYLRFVREQGLFTVDSVHAPLASGQGPLVLVPNHPSLLDVVVVITTYAKVCCVVRGSVYRSLLLRNLMRCCGHIDAGARATSVEKVLEQGADRLRRGFRVLIFPEGTRSDPKALLPFRRLPFELAARAGVPVLPIAIRCNPPAMLRKQPWRHFPKAGVTFQLTELPQKLISPNRSEVREAVSMIEAQMRQELGIA